MRGIFILLSSPHSSYHDMNSRSSSQENADSEAIQERVYGGALNFEGFEKGARKRRRGI
jgi:hypothetical protein